MDNILFIYHCGACGKHYVNQAGEPIRCRCGSKERDHVSSVNAQIIVQRILDGEDVLPSLKGE
jgi:hypothetical protein